MSTELATYQRLFDDRFHEVDETLADLPAAALLWKPFAESPWKGTSGMLGEVIAHALSSTWYLLRRAAWAMERIEWSEVDGDEGRVEFGEANHDPAYLLARSQRTQAFVREFLASLAPADLERVREHPRRASIVCSARQDIVHGLDHLSQHIGHAQLTRQLWAIHEASEVASESPEQVV